MTSSLKGFQTKISFLIDTFSYLPKGPLTEDELDVFVTHAYRKVCRLQQELAKQTALTQQR